jgi:hypothetical protein
VKPSKSTKDAKKGVDVAQGRYGVKNSNYEIRKQLGYPTGSETDINAKTFTDRPDDSVERYFRAFSFHNAL